MSEENTQQPEAKIIKLSASAAKTYEQCPRKYYYSYIEKLPKKTWPHLMLGTFCHAVLEDFHRDWNNDKNLALPKLMGDCFVRAREKYQTMTQEQLVESKTWLQAYLTEMEKQGMPNVVDVEMEFKFNVGNFLLRGFIDRLDIDKDGTFHIVDYKTSKNEKYLDDFQLLVYGMAIKQKYPHIDKFKGSYIMLRQNAKRITYNFNEMSIEECEKKILAYGKLIETEIKWEKRPSPLCSWCDFEVTCFPKEIKKDVWTAE